MKHLSKANNKDNNILPPNAVDLVIVILVLTSIGAVMVFASNLPYITAKSSVWAEEEKSDGDNEKKTAAEDNKDIVSNKDTKTDNNKTIKINNQDENDKKKVKTNEDDSTENNSSSPETPQTTISDNIPPIADAGDDQTITYGSTIRLDGRASHDPDGYIKSYSWTHKDGSNLKMRITGIPIRINHPDTATPIIIPTENINSDHIFQLKVTDSNGQVGYDEVTVSVKGTNAPPIADAGHDQTITYGSTIRLDGRASHDPDGYIKSYSWTLALDSCSNDNTTLTFEEMRAYLHNANTATPTFTAPTNGFTVYNFRLKVTDNNGQVGYDGIVVKVSTNKNSTERCISSQTSPGQYIPTPGPNRLGFEKPSLQGPSKHEEVKGNTPDVINKQPTDALSAKTGSQRLQEQNTPIQRGFVKYENTINGIRVQYPIDWSYSDHNQSASASAFTIITEFFPSTKIRSNNYVSPTYAPPVALRIAIDNLSSQDTLDHYSTSQLKSIKENNTLMESNQIIIAGIPAHKVTYVNSEGHIIMHIWTIKGSKAYHLIYNAEAANYNKYLTTIQTMINSFQP